MFSDTHFFLLKPIDILGKMKKLNFEITVNINYVNKFRASIFRHALEQYIR